MKQIHLSSVGVTCHALPTSHLYSIYCGLLEICLLDYLEEIVNKYSWSLILESGAGQEGSGELGSMGRVGDR